MLCAALDFEPPPLLDAAKALAPHLHRRACRAEIQRLLNQLVRAEIDPLPLALAVAWLSIAGTGSALPRWAARRFPEALRHVRALREIELRARGLHVVPGDQQRGRPPAALVQGLRGVPTRT